MAKKKPDTPDNTAELLAQLLEAQKMAAAQSTAPAGAITGQGIRNWQTIIIFAVTGAIGVGGWLVSSAVTGTTKLNDIDYRIKSLEASTQQVNELKLSQQQTRVDVKELQSAVGNINKSLESMSGDLKAIGYQINQLTQNQIPKANK